MKRTGISAVAAAVGTVVVGAALSAVIVVAQTPAADGHHEGAAEPSKPPGCAMMAGQTATDQKAMMAKMAGADLKLDMLVAQMNAAMDDEKVAAIAAVVTELAAQRTHMQEQMMRMQGDMMEQMMSRMSAMHGSGGMMKKTPETPKEPTGDHAAHHPEK